MTTFAGWINPETMRLVGMALLHFLWQGVAIGAVAFMAMNLARPAASRYAIAVAMLALMMAAPVLTFRVLAQRQERAANANRSMESSNAMRRAPAAMIPGTNFAFHSATVPDSGKSSSMYLLWFVEAWFLGVVLLSLRPAAGFFLIERLRLKKGIPVSGALRVRCLELQRRLGLSRVVRYCESLQLEAPAVVGWFRPVVLLPVAALTGLTTLQLEAVIAHELAHVKRLDAFVNLFQIAAETLLFYHPAVWWLSKRIRAERENCCDDVAIAACGNAVEYARALATMAEWQSAPALAMAANRSPLTERVARLLGVRKLNGGLRSAAVAGSILCLCASVLAGNALMGAAQSSQSGSAAANAATEATSPVKARSTVKPVRADKEHGPVIVIRPTEPVLAGDDAPAIAERPEALSAAPVIDPDRMFYPQQEAAPTKEVREQEKNDSRQNTEERGRARSGSYIDALKAEGITDLSIDQLIALKVQGVTAEYVRQIHAAGLKPDVDELIAMRVQGVTPEIIHELKVSGLAENIDQIIAMQVQGVTPEYVKQLHDLGIETNGDQVLGMRVQGIDGEYVRKMREATGEKLSGDELIAMKVQGVSPEYVREIKAMGFRVDSNDIIAMAVQGVTAEYIKGLQAAGLKLDTRGVITAKVRGVTPEFVERARKHGFQNLSIDKLATLKDTGVLD